ncbi:MAG: alpha/beta hydrolase [Rhodothermales bacterium]
MPYITTRDNSQLYVKDWGTGRPVILIHGWPLSADTWDEVAIPLVEAGYRAIVYDRRGFGRSEQPWAGYDYDTLSDDLADVMAATHAEAATLVGFSMGGGEVARYMSRHQGHNVVQAALVSSVVPYLLKDESNPNGAPPEVFEGMKDGLKADRADFFANFFPNFYGMSVLNKPTSEAHVEWARSTAMKASLKATLDCVDAFAKTDFRPDLAQFNVPTLIIHGDDDQIVPIDLTSRTAAEGIANATLIEYAGGPHGVFATHTAQLRDDLLNFVSQIPA